MNVFLFSILILIKVRIDGKDFIMLKYVWFFLQSLGFTLEIFLPVVVFIILQAMVLKAYEKGLMHATSHSDKLSDFKHSVRGYMAIRFLAMPGIYLHSKIIEWSAKLLGFRAKSPEPFKLQLKQLDQESELMDMGNVVLSRRRPVELSVRHFGRFAGKTHFSLFNFLMSMISRLFGALPYIMPIFVLSYLYRLIYSYNTIDVSWITKDAYLPSNNFLGALPLLLRNTFWSWKEIFANPGLLFLTLILSLFLCYGFTMSVQELADFKLELATTFLTVWVIFSFCAAWYVNVNQFCNRICQYSLVIFPLILLSELIWAIIFNALSVFKVSGKHAKPSFMDNNDADLNSVVITAPVHAQSTPADLSDLKSDNNNCAKNEDKSKSNSDINSDADKKADLQKLADFNKAVLQKQGRLDNNTKSDINSEKDNTVKNNKQNNASDTKSETKDQSVKADKKSDTDIKSDDDKQNNGYSDDATDFDPADLNNEDNIFDDPDNEISDDEDDPFAGGAY